jgi:hypothetical protein
MTMTATTGWWRAASGGLAVYTSRGGNDHPLTGTTTTTTARASPGRAQLRIDLPGWPPAAARRLLPRCSPVPVISFFFFKKNLFFLLSLYLLCFPSHIY